MRVLVTGAFGWTAYAILEAIKAADHEIIAFDLPEARSHFPYMPALASTIFLGDVRDFEQVTQAIKGANALVHLAAAVGADDYDSPEMPFATNVMGTYNVFEAAYRARIRKAVLMSAAAVRIPYSQDETIHAGDFLRTSTGSPQEHLYALTKRLQEDIARSYAAAYGINVVTLRPGYIVDGRAGADAHGRRLGDVQHQRGGWVCRHDLGTAVVKALEFAKPGYHAFHVIGSAGARQRFGMEHTESELGFTMQTRFETYT